MNVFALLVLLAATPQDLPVEQTKKNIKVLQGLPSSQLIPVMAFMANSLGVTCAHCHTSAWESDEKPAKDTARKMIALQRAINEKQFDGKLTITCNTCHQGLVIPPATPDVARSGWNATPPPKPATTISGEEAIAALPEPKAQQRVIRGTVERYNGRDQPKSAPFTLTIGPTTLSYETELSHPPEAKRALAIYLLPRPKAEQVRGERWLVTADSIRRTRETPTPLGILPEQIDHTDFRQTETGRIPFRSQWSRADYRVTFTVESEEKTVEATGKNIHVLQALHESQLFPMMNIVAGSLGVHCDYCHVRRDDKWIWESDEKKPKLVARDMMKMMFELNHAKFPGPTTVTCYSCHRGSTSVARVVSLPPQDATKLPAPDPLPSAAELLKRYNAAVGDANRPLFLSAHRESPGGSGALQVAIKSQQDVEVTFDGKTQKAEGAQLQRSLGLYAANKVRGELKVTGADRIGDREVWVADNGSTKYFFDKHSGLLLRHLTTTETLLGPLPEQADFDDYRIVAGTRLPFMITTSDGAPFDTAVRTIREVRSAP